MTEPADPNVGLYRQMADALGKLGALRADLDTLGRTVASEQESTRQALTAIGATLDTISRTAKANLADAGRLAALEDVVRELAVVLPPAVADNAYKPVNTRRWWWDLSPEQTEAPGTPQDREKARDEALADLRDWVNTIYRPYYGHMSRPMGDCWDLHPFALVILDSLSEMWSLLYLSSPRTPQRLSAQTEFQVRVVKELSEQLARECPQGCSEHGDQA